MLELKDVRFDAVEENKTIGILNGIDLTVKPGSFTVITGPNGGGKTTLAKVIMGLKPATGGQILWKGEDVAPLSVTERARRGISYGFQQPPRFKGIRVRDLLEIASGKKLSHDEACRFLTRVGLCARDYLDRDVDTSLSGGEVKRIEIATILARDAELMIFDEPEAGIDLWSFAQLTDTFTRLREERKHTVLIISHQERIIRLADEVVLVADGKVKKRGSVDEVFPLILGDAVSACSMLEVK